jgi:hypothetical protein
MGQFQFGDLILSRNDATFEDALEDAYKSKLRPICLCVSKGIPMYIARLGESYIIKRMPNTGQSHHPDCDSFEIPSELSGRGALENKAINEDHESGITNLKFDFSLTKLGTKNAISKGESKESSAVKADPAKLSIRSLLHYLYEDANLNRWTPNMEGKRNWYVIRKYLLEAAQNKFSKKNPLSDSLLIPETFSVEHKDEIVSRRRQFLTKLSPQGNKHPLGIMIGEVKDIEPARFGHKLIVKHMPETPIYFGEDVYKRINKAFSKEFSFFYENESVHLLTICTFLLSPSGSPQVDTISFMAVDRNWLPFESREELELLERLCNAKRNFIKGLRYNLTSSDVIASALLTDTQDAATAIYIVPPGATESYYEELNGVLESSNLKNTIWDINQEQPFQIEAAANK